MEVRLTNARELFDALSDPLRLRLTCCLLMVKKGLCVCELVDCLEVAQPNVSRHLRLMKAAGLVEERREGRWVCYRLKNPDHPLFGRLHCCIETVCCCADLQDDLKRLRGRLRLRRGGKCVVGTERKRRRT